MRKTLLTAIVAGAVSLAQAPQAAPLEFSGITAETVGAKGAGIACFDAKSLSCKLVRATFAGIKIEHSTVMLNPVSRRVAGISIQFKNYDDTKAQVALRAKYGEPSTDVTKTALNKQGGPYRIRRTGWSQFDRHALVSLVTGSGDTGLMIIFPENLPSAEAPKVDF